MNAALQFAWGSCHAGGLPLLRAYTAARIQARRINPTLTHFPLVISPFINKLFPPNGFQTAVVDAEKGLANRYLRQNLSQADIPRCEVGRSR